MHKHKRHIVLRIIKNLSTVENGEYIIYYESSDFHQLKEYREQANRERFILPKTETGKFFSENFKNKIYEKYFIFKILRITNRASPITSRSPYYLKVSDSYSRQIPTAGRILQQAESYSRQIPTYQILAWVFKNEGTGFSCSFLIA